MTCCAVDARCLRFSVLVLTVCTRCAHLQQRVCAGARACFNIAPSRSGLLGVVRVDDSSVEAARGGGSNLFSSIAQHQSTRLTHLRRCAVVELACHATGARGLVWQGDESSFAAFTGRRWIEIMIYRVLTTCCTHQSACRRIPTTWTQFAVGGWVEVEVSTTRLAVSARDSVSR